MSDARMSDWRTMLTCPLCGADLRGAPMTDPPAGLAPEDRFYSQALGAEIPEVYDGILYWMCPFCNGKWHRFPEGHRLRDAAQRYIRPA